jgi:hypothetical protein
VTVTFLPNSQHVYGFIPLPGYKRAMAYDQIRDTLYLADKTNNQLLRLNQVNGAWIASRLAVPNISDLGLSQDRKRLLVSKTTGSLTRFDLSNPAISVNYAYGKPFPEYRTLSQNLPVIGLVQDLVPLLTELTSPGGRQLSGIVLFSSAAEGGFLPVEGYGYKPERGGWFVRSNEPNLAYFAQVNPTTSTLFDNEYGVYSGLLFETYLMPSAFHLQYGSHGPFETLDVGLTKDDGLGYGLVNRTTFFNKNDSRILLPSIPISYRTVGSAVSPDWKYIYMLAYPIAAINGDQTTVLSPRIYVYQLDTNNYIPKVTLLPSYFEFNDFPTCRRSTNTDCLLDTLSSISLDGRTLFFAGDKGVAIVPIPSSFRTNTTFLSKAGLPNKLAQSKITNLSLKSNNSIQFKTQ